MADAITLLPCPFCGTEMQEAPDLANATTRVFIHPRRDFICIAEDTSIWENMTDRIEAWNRRASPPAREEAPALMDTLNAASAKVALNPERAAEIRANWTNGEEAPAEGAGGEIEQIIYEAFGLGHHSDAAQDATRRILQHLRNRTSEPEAGFLGHLVTPKGGDAVFVPKGERIPLISQGGSVTPIYDGPQNVTAPATTDKLRVAKEALEKIKAIYRKTPPYHAEAQTIVNQTLAALNEQPQ